MLGISLPFVSCTSNISLFDEKYSHSWPFGHGLSHKPYNDSEKKQGGHEQREGNIM